MQFINYKDLLGSDEILSFENAEKAYQMILDVHPEKDAELKRLLSEYMYQNRYGNEWEDIIGSDRKKIGDFACCLAYVYSINAR